ncbi:MAG: hypothetical protein J6B39_01100 [Lachnospiraceae bacterium]|nr:hypothetical protein [Lachnospiraceae bacterium]
MVKYNGKSEFTSGVELILDKYEYNVRVEQITKLLAEKDYKAAAKISDSIDWRRVRSVSTLTMIGEVYEGARRYEDARDILLMAYEKAPIGRRLAYRLTEVCIKGNDFKGAKKYYEDFVNLSPNDNRKYELLYEIYKKQGVAISKRIAILEEYVKNNVDEYWCYELACCYYEAGMNDNCVKQCDELFLWFGDGEYVVKALELKGMIVPLTDKQEAVVTKAANAVVINEEPVKEAVPRDKAKTVNKLKRRAAKKAKASVKSIEEQLEEREQNSANAAIEDETRDIRKEQELINSIIEKEAEPVILTAEVETDDSNSEAAATEEISVSQLAYEQPDDQIEGQMTLEEFLAACDAEYDAEVEKTADAEKLATAEVQEFDTGEVIESETEGQLLPQVTETVEADSDAEIRETVEIPEAAEVMVNTTEMSEIAEAVVRMTDEMIEDDDKGIYAGNSLTDNQKETFRQFLYMRGMEEQLVNIFQAVSERKPDLHRSADGNIMVVGDYKSGKTTLAINVIKEINAICKRYNRRIAKISGERLNNKGISETLSQINDSDLLIERAGRMSKATLQGLLQFMSGETGGMRVVFEDTKEGMEYILSQVPEARTYFAYYIELREVEIADWVEVAEDYCKENGFVIDDMAKLALSASISQISKEDFTIEYEDIKKLADEAIRKYKRRHFFKKKSGDNGMAMLKEMDFK